MSFSLVDNSNMSFMCAYSGSELLVIQRYLNLRVPTFKIKSTTCEAFGRRDSQHNRIVICWAEFLFLFLNAIASFENLT